MALTPRDEGLALLLKASTAAKHKVATDLFIKRYKLRVDDPEFLDYKDEGDKVWYQGLREITAEVEKYTSEADKRSAWQQTPWVIITVNLRHDTDFLKLKQKVEKFVKHKWIEYYAYAFEQRSKPGEKPKGFHVHIMCTRDSKHNPGKVRRDVKVFEPLVGGDTSHTLEVKPAIPGEEYGFFQYLCGEKDKKKSKKVQADFEWRAKMKLDNLYTNIKDALLPKAFPKLQAEVEEDDEVLSDEEDYDDEADILSIGSYESVGDTEGPCHSGETDRPPPKARPRNAKVQAPCSDEGGSS